MHLKDKEGASARCDRDDAGGNGFRRKIRQLSMRTKEEMLRRGFFDPVIRGRHYLQAEKEVLTDTFCQAIVYVLMKRADGTISAQRGQRFLCMLYGKLIRDETDEGEGRC